MSDGSKIGWTDASWPIVTGCTHLSEGCDNCYAAKLTSGRLRHLPAYAGLAENGRFNGTVRCLPDRMDWPYKWRKPRRIFVSDMADLFHESVPDGFIAWAWDVMGQNQHHTFQVLTKRHARMRSFARRWADLAGEDGLKLVRGPEATAEAHPSGRGQLFAAMLRELGTPPEGAAYPTFDWMDGQRWWPSDLFNVHMGVSAENQKWADIRIPSLLDTPAAVRFVSAEPLLGPIDLSPWIGAVDGAAPESRGRGLRGGSEGRVDDRRGGPDLADRGQAGVRAHGRLAADPLRAPSSGEGYREVPPGTGDVRGSSGARDGAPSGLAALSRGDTGWPDRQSQERPPRGELAGEPRIGDLSGAGSARQDRAPEGSARSVRFAQRDGDADHGTGAGDLFTPGDRRIADDDRGRLRRGHADGFEDRSRRPSLSWVIVGGESGPGHRPMDIGWLESIVSQCRDAGVPVFVKQDSDPRAGQQGRIPDDLWIKEFPRAVAVPA